MIVLYTTDHEIFALQCYKQEEYLNYMNRLCRHIVVKEFLDDTVYIMGVMGTSLKITGSKNKTHYGNM